MTTAVVERPRPRYRVPPSLGRALLLLIVYAALAQGGELLVGMDSQDLKTSTADALVGLALPVGLGILAVLAIGARWGWRGVFVERPQLRLATPRRGWLAAGLFAFVILVAVVTAPWSEWAAGVVLALLMGNLLVGVGEELVFRGYLLVGARTHYSEIGACLFTCALFGLVHGVNVVTGQALDATLGQMVFAAVMGGFFYLVRRMTGLLAIAMVLHGLFNFAFILHSPPV